MFYSTYTHTLTFFLLLDSHLQVSPYLLIANPEEGLTGPGVAEATCSHMDIVQTGHSVHLRATEQLC